MVRVNDVPRTEEAGPFREAFDEEWFVDIIYGERSILCEVRDILELTKYVVVKLIYHLNRTFCAGRSIN